MADAAARIRAGIREIGPAIAARAAEIEAARRIPPDIVETLRALGVFRIFVPQSHGGLELALPDSLGILAALAAIDGSVGWAAMIGSGSAVFLATMPRATYDAIYGAGPDAILAGSAQPAGTAEPVEGGYRVSGRWPFASGCQHAAWIFGLAAVTRDGQLQPGPMPGLPLARFFILPAACWRIEDTWHVAGLKGTGSHHVALDAVHVPEENCFDLMGAAPNLPGPLYQAPMALVPLMHAAFALGVAQGALADLVAMARAGRRHQRAATPLSESALFQYELGRAEADLRAAEAWFGALTASHWQHALAGTLRDEARIAAGNQMAIWVTAATLGVAQACFTLGGGSALYDSSPLQRRLRDLQTAAQHTTVQPRNYQAAGALLLSRGAGAA